VRGERWKLRRRSCRIGIGSSLSGRAIASGWRKSRRAWGEERALASAAWEAERARASALAWEAKDARAWLPGQDRCTDCDSVRLGMGRCTGCEKPAQEQRASDWTPRKLSQKSCWTLQGASPQDGNACLRRCGLTSLSSWEEAKESDVWCCCA
jgi:hypothetical protein